MRKTIAITAMAAALSLVPATAAGQVQVSSEGPTSDGPETTDLPDRETLAEDIEAAAELAEALAGEAPDSVDAGPAGTMCVQPERCFGSIARSDGAELTVSETPGVRAANSIELTAIAGKVTVTDATGLVASPGFCLQLSPKSAICDASSITIDTYQLGDEIKATLDGSIRSATIFADDGRPASDTLAGTMDFNDRVTVYGPVPVAIYTGFGNDTIIAERAGTVIAGLSLASTDLDTVKIGFPQGDVEAGDHTDRITITGGPADSSPWYPTISGEGGEDTISVKAGKARLKGGEGVDTLVGGAGKQFIYGGPGGDQLEGGAGPGDSLQGEQGSDVLDADDGFPDGDLSCDSFTDSPGDVLVSDARDPGYPDHPGSGCESVNEDLPTVQSEGILGGGSALIP